MATPFQTVKSQYESKDALVQKLLPILDRKADESEAQFKNRLLRVSNKKLLNLLKREELLKSKYGTREALATEIVEKRANGGKPDMDLRRKLLNYSTGRLLDMRAHLK